MGVCTFCESTIENGVPFCPFCGEPTGMCPEPEDYTYEAFISYRHMPLDAKVAKRLQHDLEGFPIPKGMHGVSGGRRLGKLFRDEDELPASTSLSDQIRDALARSRFLIVICTPETRKSRWIEREIELFASLHGRDRVVVALAEGERPSCLPDILLYRKVLSDDGTITDEPTEPLAADFRTASRSHRRNETLRLVAALLGCGFDDLRQRERSRRNAFAARIAAAIAAVSLTFAMVVLRQQGQILQRQRELQISQSRYLAKEVDELLAKGDRMQAVQIALAALPESSTSNDRPFVPEAQAALETAVQAYLTQDGWVPLYSRLEASEVRGFACNEESNTYAVADEEMTIHVYSVPTGELLNTLELDSMVSSELLPNASALQLWYPDPHRLIVSSSPPSRIVCVDPTDGSLVWGLVPDDDLYPSSLCISDNGTLACLVGKKSSYDEDYDYVERRGFVLLNAGTGDPLGEWFWDIGAGLEWGGTSCDINDDGNRVSVKEGSQLTIVDTSTGKMTSAKLAYPAGDITWIGDAIVAATYDYEVAAPYPCAVQLVSAEGKELWRTDAQLPIVSNGDLLYESEPKVWAILEGVGDLRARILVSYGGKLVTLDLETGVETEVADFVAPIVEVSVVGKSPQRVHACSANGSVRYMSSMEEGISVGSSADVEIGVTSEAKFMLGDGVMYLLTTPFYSENENAKTAVFVAYSTEDSRDSIPSGDFQRPTDQTEDEVAEALSYLEGSGGPLTDEDAVSFAMLSPDGKKAVVQTDGWLTRVDVSSGETEAKSTQRFGDIHRGGFAADGSLFYAQHPIPGDPFGRCNLLVFDMGGSLFDPKSEIRFGVMLSEDASEVIVDDQSRLRNSTWTMPYLSLDELISQARDMCVGFELTEGERAELFITAR